MDAMLSFMMFLEMSLVRKNVVRFNCMFIFIKQTFYKWSRTLIFIKLQTRGMVYVVQELMVRLDHLRSPPFLKWKSCCLICCCMCSVLQISMCPFILFLLGIMLSILLQTSDYHFHISLHFFHIVNCRRRYTGILSKNLQYKDILL